jgi:hypothetical protein
MMNATQKVAAYKMIQDTTNFYSGLVSKIQVMDIADAPILELFAHELRECIKMMTGMLERTESNIRSPLIIQKHRLF